MAKHVYYGEYSLRHWIELILKGNIVLPEWQRSFAWKEDDVLKLFDTLKNEHFIPPVIIGQHTDNDGNMKNYIVDGQQRLTSILLLYLGFFPNINKNKRNNLDEENSNNNFIEWTFDDILKLGRTKRKIKEFIERDTSQNNYKPISLEGLSNDNKEKFFDTHFLGFSYLIPDKQKQNREHYFLYLFKNINDSGKKLNIEEKIQSLFYLDTNLKKIFQPNIFERRKIRMVRSDSSILFIRTLALLADYYKDQQIASLSNNNIYDYIEQYIEHITLGKNSDIFGDISSNISKTELLNRQQTFNKNFSKSINYNKKFQNITEKDLYLFGLTYFSFFETKDFSKDIKNRLEEKIQEFLSRESSSDDNSQGTMLKLIEKSIEIYQELINE